MPLLLFVLVSMTLGAVGAFRAGGAMIRAALAEIDPDLAPARANGLPALPGRSHLVRLVMVLAGAATALLGMWAALIASIVMIAAIAWMPWGVRLVFLVALPASVVLAFRLHARNIRQPA